MLTWLLNEISDPINWLYGVGKYVINTPHTDENRDISYTPAKAKHHVVYIPVDYGYIPDSLAKTRELKSSAVVEQSFGLVFHLHSTLGLNLPCPKRMIYIHASSVLLPPDARGIWLHKAHQSPPGFVPTLTEST